MPIFTDEAPSQGCVASVEPGAKVNSHGMHSPMCVTTRARVAASEWDSLLESGGLHSCPLSRLPLPLLLFPKGLTGTSAL